MYVQIKYPFINHRKFRKQERKEFSQDNSRLFAHSFSPKFNLQFTLGTRESSPASSLISVEQFQPLNIFATEQTPYLHTLDSLSFAHRPL